MDKNLDAALNQSLWRFSLVLTHWNQQTISSELKAVLVKQVLNVTFATVMAIRLAIICLYCHFSYSESKKSLSLR